MLRSASVVIASLLAWVAVGCSGIAADDPDSDDGASYAGPVTETDVPEDALAIEPVADTYVRSNDADASFGDRATVRSDKSDSGGELRGFLKFDLTPYAALTRATLRLFVTNGTQTSPDLVVSSSTSWEEGKVTWNNQPPADGVRVATLPATEVGTFVSIDVTPFAKPGGWLSLALLPRASDGAAFASKESEDNARRPTLLIEGSDSATDTDAPAVALIAPDEGTTVTTASTLTLAADATDDVGVERVEFYDGSELLGTDTTSPFTWSWPVTVSANGTRLISAQAFDAAGNSARTDPREIEVAIPTTGDNLPPSVALTAPATGATYTTAQTVTVTATATDNLGLQRVELLDGQTVVATDTSAPFSFEWAVSSALNGTRVLTAKAYDAAGNSAPSAPVTVTVNVPGPSDNTAPTSSLTSPASGATFTTAQTVELTANVSDNNAVIRVEFYDGKELLGADTVSPFSWSWAVTAARNGKRSLTAKAYDAAGNATLSAAVPVTVDIYSGPTPTEPNLKVAFLGDTATGKNFKDVLKTIKAEKPAFAVIEGDMAYGASVATWFKDLDSVLGASFPVFASAGNHDAQQGWSQYTRVFEPRWRASGARYVAKNIGDSMYTLTFKGLHLVMVGQNNSHKATYASYVKSRLAADKHLWRVCNWHKNQAAMQVGGKGDEMGWAVYENCRAAGAIIITGHEHSYERTKTLTSMQNRTVDSRCNTADKLCVGPGRTFAAVTGLGGHSIREQLRCRPAKSPYGCKEWAKIYASDQKAKYGALFIIFNVDGNPKKARGYFKNKDGQIIDQFVIQRD